MAHILAVDDSNVTRSLIQLTLETLDNIKVDTANDVERGLKLCQQNRYDIIILDYMMPDKTGLDMIDILNEQHLQTDVPIFILSSEIDHTTKEMAQIRQVRAWLKKPFRPQMLLELITETLKDVAKKRTGSN
ncbi:response regulator [Hydrogenovibrio sp. JE_KL2]|uniref:response regulator n=1 Tax=Hydrogenovibrio sp. JE_KL2 TaxID=2651188 RepID=UPI00128C075D|nr:response regulator [Hydrogenovibrio sp. JE_KL2]MPQ77088.1 response regulator [Hydrogenovibrio sp. JE_KL2]